MTNQVGRIGFFEQLRFYVFRPDNLDIQIVWLDGHRAGYLLVRNEGGNNYITEAVRDTFRRKGLASFMLRAAIQNYPNLIAEIRSDNRPSLALHEAHGFKLVKTGAVMTYHHMGTAEINDPAEI